MESHNGKSLELISWKLQRSYTKRSYSEFLAHSVKVLPQLKDCHFCGGICVVGYVPSFPGRHSPEKVQRWPHGFWEMLPFVLGPCDVSCHLWVSRIFIIWLSKMHCPWIMISSSLFLSCSLSLKVNTTLSKSLVMTLIWFVTFPLLATQYSSLIVLLGWSLGHLSPLAQVVPTFRAPGPSWYILLESLSPFSANSLETFTHLQVRKCYPKQNWNVYHAQEVQICD